MVAMQYSILLVPGVVVVPHVAVSLVSMPIVEPHMVVRLVAWSSPTNVSTGPNSTLRSVSLDSKCFEISNSLGFSWVRTPEATKLENKMFRYFIFQVRWSEKKG